MKEFLGTKKNSYRKITDIEREGDERFYDLTRKKDEYWTLDHNTMKYFEEIEEIAKPTDWEDLNRLLEGFLYHSQYQEYGHQCYELVRDKLGEELDELFLETQKKKIEAIEKEDEKRKEAFEAEKRHQAAIVGGIGDFFGALDELSASFQDGTKEGNIRAFEMQKQLSTANIIMKTAEAVMTAQLLPPPLNAIQTGVAVATGAAQIAKVQSAQPPSMHMGGVAPDETTARVLKGEAILSRSAVAQLGGEEGIRQIEQGNEQKNETVVIIQPFKHFGRFARELGFSQPKQTGVRGY